MFIKNVSMKNFGNVENQELSFGNGLTLFSGNNGQGKSTILKCLTLLLFNQTSGKLADYIRWGTEKFEISTEFSHLGKDYKVSFEYSEKLSRRVAVNLNTNEEYLNSAAISFLDDVLDFNRAKASIVSFENEIDLITTSPSERREYLKKIYDLNFKDELQTITSDNTEAKENSSTTSGEILALEAQTFEKMSLERLPFNEETFKEHKQTLSLAEKTLSMQEKELSQAEQAVKERENLEQKEKALKYDIQEQKEKIQKTDDKLEDEKINNESIVYMIDDLERAKKEKEDDVLLNLRELYDDNKELEETLKNNVLPDINFEQYKKDIKFMEQKKYGLELEVKKLLEHTTIFESGICPTCEQKIDSSLLEENKKEIKEKETKIENLIGSISEQEEILKIKQKEYDDVASIIKEAEQDLALNKEKEKTYKRLLEDFEKEFQQDVKSREANYKHAKEMSDRDLVSFAEELENLKKVLSMQENNLVETSEKLLKLPKEESISILKDEIKKSEETIETYKDRIKVYERVVVSNEEKKKFNALQEEKERERDNKIEEKKNELEEYKEKIAITESASKLLSKEFPSFVISRMVKSLSFYINEFLAKVYPHYEIEVVESRNSLRVLYGPEKSDVKLASGFEQQVFSFAWKYALGKIQNYGLLILDEVDSAASEENSEKFYLTLAKMESYFEQIFIVTHKQDIKNLLTNDYLATVYEVEKGVFNKAV